MERARALITRLRITEPEEPDNEPLIYWRSPQGLHTRSFEQASSLDQPVKAGSSVIESSSADANTSSQRPTFARNRSHQKPLSSGTRTPREGGNPFRTSYIGVGAKDHLDKPVSELSQHHPQLDWVTAPSSPFVLAMPANHRAARIEYKSVMARDAPQVVVTPPTPAGGDVGLAEGPEEPVVTGLEAFEAERPEQREALRKEWIELIWGEWQDQEDVLQCY